MDATAILAMGVALGGGIIAAVTDLWRHRVYNVLTYPLIVSGVLFHGVVGGWEGLVTSLFGFAFGFCILLIPCLMGGIGAGDVKMLGGIGAWLGFPGIVFVFIVAGLLCGLISAANIVLSAGHVMDGVRYVALMCQGLLPLPKLSGGVEAHGEQKEKENKSAKSIAGKLPFGAMVAFAILVYTFFVV